MKLVALVILSTLTYNLLRCQPIDTVLIAINAISGMQYDLPRFSVKPGKYVRLIFSNRDDMEHNLVIGIKDSRQRIVDAAAYLGKEGPIKSYVPKSTDVLWSLPILKSGEMDTLIFRAPRSTGIYPYVCTFPGHGNIMYGGMHVTNGIMPEITADVSVPALRRKTTSIAFDSIQPSGHPYKLKPPYLYRVLMPDASPASLAVCLPHKINYCWDASSCKLRYIWSGEFLDLTDYWTIKGELHAKILGSVFYRDSSVFPFIISPSKKAPIVRFKGYRLINGFPQFHYYMDDIEVFESILSIDNGMSIIRAFKFNTSEVEIRFIHSPYDRIQYTSDQGQWNEHELILNAKQAKAFSITMKRKDQ